MLQSSIPLRIEAYTKSSVLTVHHLIEKHPYRGKSFGYRNGPNLTITNNNLQTPDDLFNKKPVISLAAASSP
jgi:hypothetical protein